MSRERTPPNPHLRSDADELPKPNRVRGGTSEVNAPVSRPHLLLTGRSTVWFSPWAPLPIEVPRGPYTVPNRATLRKVENGLLQLKRRSDEQ